MKAKRIFLSALAASFLLLSACSVKVANMTPSTVPTNPSGIYTLTVKADVSESTIDKRTVAAYVVIDGEKHLMKRSDLGAGLFDYDYQFPQGKRSARYHYIITYRMKSLTGEPAELREITSPTQEIELIERYSITLDADRAPAGTKLAVLGRGFSEEDRVHVGGEPAETRFVSGNNLEFTVPDLDPGSYAVDIRNGAQTDPAGRLRVDAPAAGNDRSDARDGEAASGPSGIRVLPERLDLEVGEKRVLAFALDAPAPDDGLDLNVTTDIPDSIIMPEVVVPGGARTVNVTVEGNAPGEGKLYIRRSDSPALVVPLTVR